MKVRKPSLETTVLLAIYGIVFFYFIFQKAIFSPDSYSYLLAMPQRNPGYVIFSKFFEFVFPQNYAQVIVGVQLILGLAAVHVFFKQMSQLLNLNYLFKGLILIALIFPFFPPLLIANNICSEGLAYPFYLLVVVLGFEFLYHEKKYTLPLLLILSLLLVLTRGQFIVTSIIFAFVYFFKNRSTILDKRYLLRFIVILLFPVIVVLTDKTYHKVKDGVFMSTPYTFVNLSTAPFYVSNETDADFIKNEEYKSLFKICHKRLEEKKLLMSSKKRNGYDDAYQHYHSHLPQICNQTYYQISRDYFYAQYLETHIDEKAASVFSLKQSELFCKSMFFALVKPNFQDWSLLYYSNIVHGFKSLIIMIFVVFVFLFSSFKVIFKTKKSYEILFICSALTLSNAMIISLASHSIMRYLFYNYILILFMIILLIKNSINAKND